MYTRGRTRRINPRIPTYFIILNLFQGRERFAKGFYQDHRINKKQDPSYELDLNKERFTWEMPIENKKWPRWMASPGGLDEAGTSGDAGEGTGFP